MQTVKVIEKPLEINSLDQLKIETAVRMGQKAFVTINGETFEEGDLINDALIEKIENEKVTFKIGKTSLTKVDKITNCSSLSSILSFILPTIPFFV